MSTVQERADAARRRSRPAPCPSSLGATIMIVASAITRDERLEQHRAVADRMAVRLASDLLRRRARADEAVEARARAARDGDEQEREQQAGRPADVEALERGLLDRRSRRRRCRACRRRAPRTARSRRGSRAAAAAIHIGTSDATKQYARISTTHVVPVEARAPSRAGCRATPRERRRHEDHRRQPQRRLQEALRRAPSRPRARGTARAASATAPPGLKRNVSPASPRRRR